MNYTELLNELIEHSGKTVKQIADECQREYGVNLTNTYLSGLKTTEGRQASQEINIAIAKACGAEYENILVIQAFLDRAPLVLVQFLEMVKEMATTKHPFEKEDELTELLEADSELSLAEFICKSIKMGEIYRQQKREESEEKKQAKAFVITADVLKNLDILSEDELNTLLGKS